jgi:hypothetical protein
MLTAGSHSSGFRGSRFQNAKTTCLQDPRYPDGPNTDQQLPVGLFPMASIAATRPFSDGRSRSLWDFETCDVPTFLSSGTPISQCRICRRSLDLRHVSPLTDGPDLPGISRLEVSRFSFPRESRFPDDCYPDGYAPCRDFLLLSTKVNLVHLLSNLTADGYLLQI